jgi:hypothetical protein
MTDTPNMRDAERDLAVISPYCNPCDNDNIYNVAKHYITAYQVKCAELEAEKAQRVIDKTELTKILVLIFENRNYARCWFSDGDCANWFTPEEITEGMDEESVGCTNTCPIVMLRNMLGVFPTEDGSI